MQKVSAFSVYSANKDTVSLNKSKDEISEKPLHRISSAPIVNIEDTMENSRSEKSKGKSLFKVFKSNSLRQSMRLTPKIRNKLTTKATLDIAGDESVKLTKVTSAEKPPKAVTVTVSNNDNNTNSRQQKLLAYKDDTPKMPSTKKVRVDLTSKLPPSGKPPKTIAVSISDKNKKLKHHLNNEGKLINEEPKTKKLKMSEDDNSHANTGEESESNEENEAFMYDSVLEGKKIFQHLIHPVKAEKFMNELWEKKPLLLKRHMKEYNIGWFSCSELDRILRRENIEFSVNLDVTSYKDGVRQTHNPIGRAYASNVWDFYQNGCSVRLLNPQTYSRNVWKLLAGLQEHFSCCMGANVYLTPPGTQGFAPHYDDIEAFILQLEGKKHWRLYNPTNETEVLPRFSSKNLKDKDIGKPILETVLEPGDLLYFPRGTIHQGRTLEDAHSLHITVSCYQKHSWADLFEKLLPAALEMAIEEDIEMRKGLPLNFLSYTGITNSERDCHDREAFFKKVQHLAKRVIENMPVDAACDQLGKRLMHDSLPPVLTNEEKKCSVHNQETGWQETKNQPEISEELEPDTQVKVLRKGILRMLAEDDQVRVFYCTENSRLYHQTDQRYVVIRPEVAPGVEYLLEQYPNFVTIESLPLETLEEKIEICSILYDNGLLRTNVPLQDDDSCDCETESDI